MGIFTEAIRKDRLHIALLAFPFLLTALVWDQLPDRSPFRLHIDETAQESGGYALIFMPLVNVAVWILLVALPHLDVRRRHYLQYSRAYSAIRLSIILFLTTLNCAALLRTIGYDVSTSSVVLYTVLFLLMAAGSRIQQLDYDHPFGIRTVWALGSREVWRTVHRFASRLWIGIAVIFFTLGVLADATIRMYLVLVVVVAATGIPIVYSYIVHRRNQME